MTLANAMIGCVTSVASTCLIAIIWYNPALPFGKLWMHRTFPGKSAKEVARQSRMAHGFSLISSLFLTLLLRFVLIDFMRVKILQDAVAFGVGLASLTAFLEFPHSTYSQRPFDLYIIDQMYNFAVTAASSVCIFYFH